MRAQDLTGVDLAGVARELLGLEGQHQSASLSVPEQNRWSELTVELIRRFRAEHDARRNLRLPARFQATVVHAGATRECAVVDLSHVGLSFIGDFKQVARGDAVGVHVDGGRYAGAVRLPCVAAWTAALAPDTTLVGVKITSATPSSQRRSYFNQAYYPTYIHFLQRLCDQARPSA